MVRRKAGLKSVRREKTKKALNKSRRTLLKTAIKRYKKLISVNDIPAAKKAFILACSSLDKAASKGVIPKERAARKKGQLARLLGKTTIEPT